MSKTQEALKLALEAICGSGDFLFNWHDCEPNNEREIQRYQATLADNEKAFKAIREALADHIPDATKMIEQPAPVAEPHKQQEPVAVRALAKRRIFDYIRGAYDLGYNDARNAKAVPGDGAPGYKGREVEADHGGALLSALQSLASPPASKPLTDEKIEEIAARTLFPVSFARAIEAAHGIKENT